MVYEFENMRSSNTLDIFLYRNQSGFDHQNGIHRLSFRFGFIILRSLQRKSQKVYFYQFLAFTVGVDPDAVSMQNIIGSVSDQRCVAINKFAKQHSLLVCLVTVKYLLPGKNQSVRFIHRGFWWSRH